MLPDTSRSERVQGGGGGGGGRAQPAPHRKNLAGFNGYLAAARFSDERCRRFSAYCRFLSKQRERRLLTPIIDCLSLFGGDGSRSSVVIDYIHTRLHSQ